MKVAYLKPNAKLENITPGVKYQLLVDKGKTFVIRDDSGKLSSRMKQNFIFEDVEHVICTTNKFKFLKQGKEYLVASTLGGFFYIINEKMVLAKYHESNFEKVIPPIASLEEQVPPAPIKHIKCVYPITDVISYGQNYAVVGETETQYHIKDDNNKDAVIIKKRFICVD